MSTRPSSRTRSRSIPSTSRSKSRLEVRGQAPRVARLGCRRRFNPVPSASRAHSTQKRAAGTARRRAGESHGRSRGTCRRSHRSSVAGRRRYLPAFPAGCDRPSERGCGRRARPVPTPRVRPRVPPRSIGDRPRHRGTPSEAPPACAAARSPARHASGHPCHRARARITPAQPPGPRVDGVSSRELVSCLAARAWQLELREFPSPRKAFPPYRVLGRAVGGAQRGERDTPSIDDMLIMWPRCRSFMCGSTVSMP